jgi:hypothetical protein
VDLDRLGTDLKRAPEGGVDATLGGDMGADQDHG